MVHPSLEEINRLTEILFPSVGDNLITLGYFCEGRGVGISSVKLTAHRLRKCTHYDLWPWETFEEWGRPAVLKRSGVASLADLKSAAIRHFPGVELNSLMVYPLECGRTAWIAVSHVGN